VVISLRLGLTSQRPPTIHRHHVECLAHQDIKDLGFGARPVERGP
jgi:hypothetical protein